MWRWLLSIGLTAASVAAYLMVEPPPLTPPYGDNALAKLAFSFLIWLLSASPTVLYYRLLIFAGERLPRARMAGVAGFLILGAIAPPLIHNQLAVSREAPRNFAANASVRSTIVAVEDRHWSRELLERGIASCADDCLRLLFGADAGRVIVGDPHATGATAIRSAREADEPERYPTAYALRVERRENCPAILTSRDPAYHTLFPEGPRMTSHQRRGSAPSLEDRVAGLLASGHCLVAEPGSFDQGALRLGTRQFRRDSGIPPQPDARGLLAGAYQFVERRDGDGWKRIGQRMTLSYRLNWTIPFGFLPNQYSWFAARTKSAQVNMTGPEGDQPWRWMGILLPEPAFIGHDRVHDLLHSALAQPPDAPRDARHMLAFQYLRRLSEREPSSADLALLRRLIEDPRISFRDLEPLRAMASRREGEMIGFSLARRMARAAPLRSEIRSLAYFVSDLPRDTWPAMLPEMRRLAMDRERAGDVREAFKLFAAGNHSDAALLLRLFRDEWPPMSLAQVMQPSPSMQREKTARDARIAAYLVGLCAASSYSSDIRPALVEIARTAPLPNSASGANSIRTFWRTLANMGVSVEALARERRASADERREIVRIARERGRFCERSRTP